MTTLQDLCSQLMKPAKDLAEWNFPLAKILEDYYALMQEPCNLNFSEAALVLQNSANVYVRRVEYLYQDTTALSKSMQENEDEVEEEQKKDKSHRRPRKAIIDFKNFDLVDFSVGILKKNHEREKSTKEERKIKLISPRFPQLENVSRHKFSQDIIDIAGEVIGKKYDFRCNQQLTVSKMLIEEVTPSDFNNEKSDHLNISNINIEQVDCDDDLDLCSDDEISRDETIFNQTQESGYESMVSTSQLNTSDTQTICDFSQSINNSLKDVDDPIMSPIADSSIESDESPNDSGLEQSKTPDEENNELCEQNSANNSPVYSERHSENNPNKSSTNDFDKTDIENSLNNTSQATGKPMSTRDSTETDAGYTSGDPDDLQMGLTPKKSNKTIEEPNNLWEPISVESVVPDKIPRRRREFKLPCHIALLTSVPKLRKRTLTDSAKKRYSKKSSGKRAKNITETEEINKMFEEYLKMQPKLSSQSYEAVLNENMDCLGYQLKLESLKKSKKNISEHQSIHPSVTEVVSSPSPLSHSPCASSDHIQDDDDYSEVSDNLGFQTVGQNHQERIERKMKELKKKFDVTHDREEESAKWFETVEALKAVENRPSFHVDEYEKRIIESLKAKNEHQVEFHEIAEQEEPGNIARLFVASLHLANTYNVEINVVNKEDNSELNLKLLDAEFNPTT
ncbi:uncharacterized protein [Chelonus insularis]|uniref:uncharacterized protein n=1 Tax=Chelonus insularis TaxID=460826 RepID=UPI00158B7A8E|nr:uncharacterized protein LOC118072796 [Chelonus insularis]